MNTSVYEFLFSDTQRTLMSMQTTKIAYYVKSPWHPKEYATNRNQNIDYYYNKNNPLKKIILNSKEARGTKSSLLFL